MPIDLTPYADSINAALAEQRPCVLATIGEDGMPDIGFKGSLQVFDQDHLCYWERTRGQQLANLRGHPGTAVLYFNRDQRRYLRMFGQATLFEEGPVRDQIMARTPEQELNFDPERKGVGVLIRVDRLLDPFARVTQSRDEPAASSA